ncbi:hypothetical protein ACRRTK_001277 [Alexandromys fortis]
MVEVQRALLLDSPLPSPRRRADVRRSQGVPVRLSQRSLKVGGGGGLPRRCWYRGTASIDRLAGLSPRLVFKPRASFSPALSCSVSAPPFGRWRWFPRERRCAPTAIGPGRACVVACVGGDPAEGAEV